MNVLGCYRHKNTGKTPLMILQIITIALALLANFVGEQAVMKRVWSGLLLGIGALPAVAATCEQSSRQGDVQGKFDASGEVCFSLPELDEITFPPRCMA